MEISYKYAIRPIKSEKDKDLHKLFAIYEKTTPPSIKTNSNDFIFWLNHKPDKFDFFLFALYLNDELIGMAMASHVDNLLIFDYIALKEEFENTFALYFSYIDLIDNYITEIYSNIEYRIMEISANSKGLDKESVRFKKIFCLNGYGTVNFPYQTLPLGDKSGTSFDTHLYIKSNEIMLNIHKNVYLEMIHSIYFNYYCAWYNGILTREQYRKYFNLANSELNKLEETLKEVEALPVKVPICYYAENKAGIWNTSIIPSPCIKYSGKTWNNIGRNCLSIIISVMIAIVALLLLKVFCLDTESFLILIPILLGSLSNSLLLKNNKANF